MWTWLFVASVALLMLGVGLGAIQLFVRSHPGEEDCGSGGNGTQPYRSSHGRRMVPPRHPEQRS